MIRTFSRFGAFALCLILLLGAFTACNISFGGGQEDGRPYVVCTVFPQYDFLRNIAGDKVRAEMLMMPGTETHSFGLKDISIAKLDELHEADLFLFVGGESDEALMEELQSSIKSDAVYKTMLSMIDEPLCNDTTPGMEEEEHDHDHEHSHEEELDEHVWTSPKRAMELVDGILAELVQIDPENASFYEENAEAYKEKLAVLDGKFEELKEKKTFNTLIFADRFPFRYLCTDYGILADAAFLGCSSAVEPSLTTLDALYKKASELGLPAILYMESSNPSYAETLAKRTGGQALMLHSCHILSEKDFESRDYISLMEQNLNVLKIALGAE